MLTLKLINEETERVIRGLEKKHFANAKEAVEQAIELDKIRRETQAELDAKNAESKRYAAKIGQLMKQGLRAEADEAKAEVAALKTQIATLQEKMNEAEANLTRHLCTIPNIPSEDVPEGADASSNVVVKEGGVIHWPRNMT